MREPPLRISPRFCVISRRTTHVETNLTAEPRPFLRASRRILAFVAVSMLMLAPAASEEAAAGKVVVFQPGIYQAVTAGPHRAHSTLGPVAGVRNEALIVPTTTIPARESLRFGLRYVVLGIELGGEVDIQLITRFPKPGLTDPLTGARITESQYSIRTTAGAIRYREFRFDHSWEMLPGKWVFEFWHAGRKIGSQTFCVIQSSQIDEIPSARSSHFGCDRLIS